MNIFRRLLRIIRMFSPTHRYGCLSVSELKSLLRERGGSLKGKKKDLIERLKFYDLNNNFSHESPVNYNYDMPIEMILPDIKYYRDVNADSVLPSLTMSNILNYLDRFGISVDSGKQMYDNHFMLSVRMALSGEKCFFQSRCKASMKKAVIYISNVQITLTGLIDGCQCDCAVGEAPNAHCKHVVALLLAIEQLKRERKITLNTTSTQELQHFHKPKKQYFGSPVRAKNLPHKHFMNFKPVTSKTDASKYRERVRNLCINYLGHSSSRMPFKHTIHPANLYAVFLDHNYCVNSEDELLKSLKITSITDDEIIEIEALTRGQNKSQRWQDERRVRITASNFYQCCNSISQKAKENLAKRILDPTSFKSKQTQHGKDCESKAINFYVSLGVEVRNCGLIIMKKNPFLGASPDGLIGDDTLLEVKCPYNQRNSLINAQTIPFLYTDSYGRLCLDPSHQYYFQIQGQLMVTGKKFANLFVYTSIDWKIIDVPRNEKFINEMEAELLIFFNDYFKPALLEKYLYKNYSKHFSS